MHPPTSTRARLRGRSTLALVALSVVVTAFAVGASASGSQDCAAADPTVRVGVVVDFGLLAGEQGAPRAPAVRCTPVAQDANGFQILEAAGFAYTVDGSGLLCSIDGFPNDGACGQRTGTGYRYWAYYHGAANGWTYSGIGPGGSHARGPEVEGWHFVDGAGNKSDPPPAGPSDPSAVCSPVVPSTPPPTPPASGPPASTAPVTRPGRGEPVPGDSGSPLPGSPNSATTVASVAPGADPASIAADPGADPSSGSDLTGPPGAATGDRLDGAVPGTATAGAGGPGGAGGPDDVALEATPSSGRSPSGSPVGPILVVLSIVVLGGVAARRFRSGERPG